MYQQRRNHRTKDWQYFCDWIEGLPYFKELAIGEQMDKMFKLRRFKVHNTNIDSGQPNKIVAGSKIEESFPVKIKRLSENGILPTMAHPKDACYDLYATVNTTIIPNEIVLIPTDLSIELPDNFEAQIRPRSGLALKHGITVLNAPATIDKNFTGNVSIILINLGRENYDIKFGDRIAQIAFRKIDNVYFEVVEKNRGN